MTAEEPAAAPEPELKTENTGDGPSSSALFTEPHVDPREAESGDGPSSVDTCGQFPQSEVYATFSGDDIPPELGLPPYIPPEPLPEE